MESPLVDACTDTNGGLVIDEELMMEWAAEPDD